jgi:hypothetical protein
MRVTSLVSFDIETGAVLAHIYTDGYEGPWELCDRSIQKSASQQAGTNEGIASTAGANASQIGSSIIPGLEAEAQGGQGLTAAQKNAALVSGAQAIGGVNSGVTGDANLAASRTRNAGGFTGALDDAARIKSRQQSANALGVENESTQLANEKQLAAQKELGGLYGTDTSAQLQAMGLSNQSLGTAIKAGDSGWLQNTDQTLASLGQLASGEGKLLNG